MIRAHVCILSNEVSAIQNYNMKQVDIDDKLHFSPVYQQDRRFPALFLSTELIPKMTSHDGSSSA